MFFTFIFLLSANAFLFPYPSKNVPGGFKPNYGFSYSFENASWYGLDSKQAYIQLLDCCNFKWVRLPFFWDKDPSTHSVRSGQYELGNIEDLEFAIAEAKKRNIGVIVALGLKTPYFPEYHLPQNLISQLKFGETINLSHPVTAEVLEIDKKLVERLSKHENIIYWQIENEPFLANINNWKIDKSVVAAEAEIVRQSDPKKRPLILSHVGPSIIDSKWKSLVPILDKGDALGVNVYFKTQGVALVAFKLFGKNIEVPWPKGFVWPVQSWYFLSPNFESMKKKLSLQDKKLFVMELQADPYIRTLDDARRKEFYFSAEDVKKGDKYIRDSRVEFVGLWGSAFWLFREKLGDESWLNTVIGITR